MGVDLATGRSRVLPAALLADGSAREGSVAASAVARSPTTCATAARILFDTRDLTLGASRGAGFAGPANAAPPARQARSAAAGAGAGRSCADESVLSAAGFSRPLGRRQGVGGSAAAGRSRCGPAPARGGDGVSPVIIGGNDWAAAWAVDAKGAARSRVSPGGDASANWRSASASMS